MLIVDNQKESELPYWVKPILGVAFTSKRILQKSMVEERQRLDAIHTQGFFKLSCANSYTIANKMADVETSAINWSLRAGEILHP